MTDPLAIIQATAKQTQERHQPDPGIDSRTGQWCECCTHRVLPGALKSQTPWPCPDFVAAGVVLDAATQLAEQREVEGIAVPDPMQGYSPNVPIGGGIVWPLQPSESQKGES